MSHTKHHNPRKQISQSIILAITLLMAGLSLLTASAHAGQIVEVACENPNGSSAPSQNWEAATAGHPGVDSNASAACNASSPMFASLSAAGGSEPVGAGELVQYQPSTGDTLIGGTINLSLWGDGTGTDANATAVAYTPELAYNASNVFFQCSSGESACGSGGTPNDYTGTLPITENRGGNLYVVAACGGLAGQSCSEHAAQVGSFDAYSLIEVHWADLRLENNATPGASNIAGTLLTPGARGSTDLTLTATDPNGPGVYSITVKADNKTLYTGTPDTNSAKCVPVGESAGALMFDYTQPCKQSETVEIPVETTGLADGSHTLKVSVKDAAGNESTVYDNTITTKNAPANTNAPAIVAYEQVLTGTQLASHPGTWSAPSGAGTITYSYQWQDCSTSGESCQPIIGAEAATYTPTQADVGHTLRLAVTAADTDGYTTTTSPASRVVEAPQSSSGASNGPGTGTGSSTGDGNNGGSNGNNGDASGGAQTGGATAGSSSDGTSSQGSSGAPAAAAGAGTPNGLVASSQAGIQLGLASVITRTYAHRAFTVPGRLLNAQGEPITGATLEVLQQPLGSSTSRLVARAQTQGDGSFSAVIPAGSSRLITIAYRAYSQSPTYAAKTTILERVGAGVQLRITPHHASPTGTIKLAGTVAGPIPRHGVIVELLVHYLGQWVPFSTPRTKHSGYFHVTYHFKGARGRFPFKVQVRGGQTGFPYAVGYSPTINVRTH